MPKPKTTPHTNKNVPEDECPICHPEPPWVTLPDKNLRQAITAIDRLLNKLNFVMPDTFFATDSSVKYAKRVKRELSGFTVSRPN